MLNMIKGCRVNDPSILQEAYEKSRNSFAANVNAEKIQPLLEHFITLHNEQCFLILEIPTNFREEPPPNQDGTRTLHKDVYYLDGLTAQSALDLLHAYGELLIHDGLSSFGFGLHSGANEIMVGKYNVVTVYTKTPKQYRGFFEAHGIRRVWRLKTAWDYFTSNTPGDSFSYQQDGKSVYALAEHLKQYGLYLAERRED